MQKKIKKTVGSQRGPDRPKKKEKKNIFFKTHLRLAKQLIRNDGLPEEEAVLEPVHARVLGELLVERGDGREEDDGVDVVEEGRPGGAQRARAPDVVHEPLVPGFGA